MNIYEQILLPSVKEYNEICDPSNRIEESPTARLSGQGGPLDSLELVNFIVVVEKKIRVLSGKEARLVTEEALGRSSSPFLSLDALEKFVKEIPGLPS